MAWSGRLVAVGVALAAGSCSIGAKYRPAEFREEPMGVASFVVPAGLQVLAEKDTGAALVGMALTVGVGARADPPGKEGLAHLVEHLAFRARMKRGYTVTEALEYAGVADHNGYTDHDLTTYAALGPRETLPALLAVAAAVLEGGPVDPEVFAVERAVVEAELQRGSDRSSREVAQWWMREALYPAGHPASRPVIGTRESLRAITLEDVARFRAEHYRPGNATLALSGGVSLPTLQALLAAGFPPPASGERRPPASRLLPEPPPPPPEARLLHRTAPISEEELYLGWSLPSRFAQRDVLRLLEVTLRALTLGISADVKEVKSVSVRLRHGLHDARLRARLVLRPGADPERVMAEVTTRIDRRLESSRASITRLRSRSSTFWPSTRSAMERAVTRATLAQGENELRLILGEEYLQAAEDWSPELAWLRADRARGVHVSPGGLLAVAEAESRQAVLPSQRSASVRFPPDVVQQVAQKVGAEGVVVERLGNGLQVAVLKAPRFANTAVALLLPGGSALASPPGAAEFALALGHTNVTELRDPRSAGAISARHLSGDGLRYLLVGQGDNLDSMLGWLRYRLTGTWKVEWGVLPTIRLYARAEFKAADGLPQLRAQREFQAALWRGTPYGGVISDTWEAVAALDEADLQRWLQRTHTPDQAVLVVVGNVEPARALALARAELGALERGPHFEAPPAPPAGEVVPRALLTSIRDMTQVGVRWGCPAPMAGPRQAATARLVASWLSFQLTDRLRERSGAAYATDVGTEHLWRSAGALTASLEVPGRQLEALLRTLEELLSGRTLEAPQLLNAAWDELRARNGRYELPEALALDLAEHLRDGWPTRALDDAPGQLVSTSVEEVRAMLEACRASQVYSFVGDPLVVSDAVKASGLGARLRLEETGPRR